MTNCKETLSLINTLFEIPYEVKVKPWFVKPFVKKGIIISLGNYMFVDNLNQVDIPLIFHEATHYADRCFINKNNKFEKNFIQSSVFYLKYLFPQCLIIFSLLSFFNIWFLCFLIFALPNPYLSFFRKNYELRGYLFDYIFYENLNFSKTFNSFTYYKMDILRNNEYYINLFEKMLKNPDDKLKKLLNFIK